MKKLVMVDCLSQHRIRYCVEVEDDIEHALDEVVMQSDNCEFLEFSQEHLTPSPVILSYREISKEDYLSMFNEDNDYLIDWSEEQKLNWINKINYNKPDPVGG
jgi:hypothetical protein